MGRARRAYRVPPLRLTGLFTVPTISVDGYAGLVTYLLDGGRL